MELTASALGRKWSLTRARIHQLVRQGRISPAPEKRMVAERMWVYIFKPNVKVLPPSRRPGRPKALDSRK